MRLARLTFLPASLVSALDQAGIRTDTDLLFLKTPHEIFHSLPPGTVSFHDLMTYIFTTADTSSAAGVPASDLLLEAGSKSNATNDIPIIGDLLGGLGNHQIIEITGDHHSEKSMLALNVVLYYLIRHGNASAIWFDTTGGFSAERATQILESHPTQQDVSVLERLQVTLTFDADEVLGVLDATVRPESVAAESKLRFIVIDTITTLLGPNLSVVSAQGHAKMVYFMRHLRELACEKQLVILVLNNTAAAKPSLEFPGANRKPALGPSFSFLTDTTLWLTRCDQRIENSAEHKLTLEIYRSRLMRPRALTTLSLLNGVISAPD
ncbi:hypothetical protein AX17_006574 [Amanita inopinata Kibby_2008]|nr:hypothetical protein AX17_006574 [Amanita inopinata Kibby_2008]